MRRQLMLVEAEQDGDVEQGMGLGVSLDQSFKINFSFHMCSRGRRPVKCGMLFCVNPIFGPASSPLIKQLTRGGGEGGVCVNSSAPRRCNVLAGVIKQ